MSSFVILILFVVFNSFLFLINLDRKKSLELIDINEFLVIDDNSDTANIIVSDENKDGLLYIQFCRNVGRGWVDMNNNHLPHFLQPAIQMENDCH